MSAGWAKLETHVVNGVFPLRRCVGSSDRSGVFLTQSASHAPADVALKLIHFDTASADAQLSQWRAAAGLSHPHLVRIFETGECHVAGLHCLYALMEYAEQNLAQLLEQRALTEAEAREMLEPTLSALDYLHGRELLHGRLKPSNVLVVGDQLKLASDTVRAVGAPAIGVNALGASAPTFGVQAIGVGEPAMGTGAPEVAVGAPEIKVGATALGGGAASAYHAPETREGDWSTASDIWALGATLCEALTRRQPSGLHGAGEVELPSELPAAFREIIARCLSRDPRDRPQVSELQSWLRGGAEGPAAAAATSPQPPAAVAAASAQPPAATAAAADTSPVAPAASAAPAPDAPTPAKARPTQGSTTRLVIRVELPSEETTAAIPPRSGNRALRWVSGAVGAAALLALVWIGYRALRVDPPAPTPATVSAAPDSAQSTSIEAEPTEPQAQLPSGAESVQPRAQVSPDAGSVEPRARRPLDAESVERQGRTPDTRRVEPRPQTASRAEPLERQAEVEPDPATPVVHEVLPAVPRSALQTIRGTVRVSIRAIVSPDGTVLAATPEDPGPSRYFERLSLEASKQWRFAPADTQEQRLMLVRFNYTRWEATASASPLQ